MTLAPFSRGGAATLLGGEVDGPFDRGHDPLWTRVPKSDMRPFPGRVVVKVVTRLGRRLQMRHFRSNNLSVIPSRRSFMAVVALAGVALSGTAAIALSQAADWRPAALVGLLLVLAVGSDAVAIDVRGVR